MAGGVTMHLGPSARLRVIDSGADVAVVICSHRFQCLDLELFRGFGVEPEIDKDCGSPYPGRSLSP